MPSQHDKTNTEPVQRAVKNKYKTPVLRHFGLVTELTNSFSSNCQSDNEGCTPQAGNNMGPMLL